MKKCMMLVDIALAAILPVLPQNKPKLAILPFTVGEGKDGETIASLLVNQSVFDKAFIVRPREQCGRYYKGTQYTAQRLNRCVGIAR
jgi:hypothetical protein